MRFEGKKTITRFWSTEQENFIVFISLAGFFLTAILEGLREVNKVQTFIIAKEEEN